MILQKVKKYFPFFYILLLILSTYYVYDALKSNDLDVSIFEKSENQKEIEVKPVKVTLEIVSSRGSENFEKSLLNTSTVEDLVLKIKNENGLVYERIGYVYGYEFDLVNGEKAPDGYLWKIYENGTDVTFEAENRKLVDGYNYKISLEKR